jgi:hypothetical protein
VLGLGAGALVAVFVMVLFSEDRRETPLILVWCPSIGITPEAPTDDYLYEAGPWSSFRDGLQDQARKP